MELLIIEIINTMKYYLLLMIVLFTTCKCKEGSWCDKTDSRLLIQNIENFDIVFVLSSSYPDTINYIFDGCPLIDLGNIVSTKSIKPYDIFNNWEDKFNKIPSKTLMVFIYNSDTANYFYNLSGNHCDSLIQRKDLILKRFDVTLDYLNTHNWTLTYP